MTSRNHSLTSAVHDEYDSVLTIAWVIFSLAWLGIVVGCNAAEAISEGTTGNAAAVESVATPIDSVALAERAPARGDAATLFEQLPAERTGVDFVHVWDPPPKYEFKSTQPRKDGGVTIGDYDGDGRPDIYLTRPFEGSRLYRNLGDFRC